MVVQSGFGVHLVEGMGRLLFDQIRCIYLGELRSIIFE
jgi:hypothetical protein